MGVKRLFKSAREAGGFEVTPLPPMCSFRLSSCGENEESNEKHPMFPTFFFFLRNKNPEVLVRMHARRHHRRCNEQASGEHPRLVLGSDKGA